MTNILERQKIISQLKASNRDKKVIEMLEKMNIDPFLPTNFVYIFHEEKPIGVIQLGIRAYKTNSKSQYKTIYHFTNENPKNWNLGVFRFNCLPKDEVLNKFWFVESTKDKENNYKWNSYGPNWEGFSLANITRTACFFTGKPGSRNADEMKKKFGENVLKVNYPSLKNDVELFCKKYNKILYIDKTKYVKYSPMDYYPLPIIGKTNEQVGLEVSSILEGLMQDGTCFNKTWGHRFEQELRFIFFDVFSINDLNNQYIEVPVSKGTLEFI